MAGSRTIKTLTALFVAMTMGSLALMILETDPIRPSASLAVLSPPPAGAANAIYEADVPLQPGRWGNVIVHAAGRPTAEIARECHFLVIADGDRAKVTATAHWRRQQDGHHVGGYWRRKSIGVCLIGDFSRRAPQRGQFDELVDLVNTLQEVCRIPAERVYLRSDLDARSTSPGRAFPAARFSARLLRPQP
jgi:hypothetical protein